MSSPDGDFDLQPGEKLVVIRDEPNPGDKVRIIAGRHRGAEGVLNSIVTTVTPSGAGIVLALVARPRGGITAVFSHEIERVE